MLKIRSSHIFMSLIKNGELFFLQIRYFDVIIHFYPIPVSADEI
jgi:hypothetical protein